MSHPDPAPQNSMVWPYRADLPQRWALNRAKYLSRGGRVRLEEDVRAFLAGSHNEGDMGRFYFFCLLLDQLIKEGLQGDVAELGVYKGNTASLLANIARQIGGTAYLFDTFEGFDRADLQGVDAGKKVEFEDTSLEAVRALVGYDNVHFVRGRFPDSAAQIPQDLSFCVVHIDCDLYAPMRSGLEYFYPRLLPGGFLVLHDYSSLVWDGAEKAIDEFFADKPEPLVPLTDGAGSVVVRKTRLADHTSNWLIRRKRSVFDRGWVDASPGGLDELLESGWSAVEAWGVWGLGELHRLKLFLPYTAPYGVNIEADVTSVLMGERTSQQIDVEVAGEKLATWTFSLDNNRALRTFQIPAEMVGSKTAIFVDFRPRSVATPIELDPSALDDRQLGLGLYRLRQSPARPEAPPETTEGEDTSA